MEVNLHLEVFQTSGTGSDTSEPSEEGRRIFVFESVLLSIVSARALRYVCRAVVCF